MHMIRTTIMLPEGLKESAMLLARRRGMTLAKLIREALAKELVQERAGRIRDALFEDKAVYRGAAPEDGALRHDQYLSER